MKWSKYNIETEVNGIAYLYNSLSNALIQVDEELRGLIEMIKAGKEDVANYELTDQLNAIKFIVKSDEDELNSYYLQALNQRYEHNDLYLTIAPTQECNLDCIYCYEKWREPKYLNINVENAIVEFISKKLPNYLNIVWFGGEPLLALNSIISLCEKINRIGIRSDYSIVTNGISLDLKTFSTLVRHGFSQFQITLDGERAYHDSRRPKKDGSGSFDQIHQNISNIIEYCRKESIKNVKINIRVNIDKSNSSQYAKLLKYYSEFDPENLLCVSPGITKDHNNCTQLNCFSTNEYIDFALNLYKKSAIKIIDFYPSNTFTECFARHYNSYLIGPDGRLYKCWHDLGDNEKSIGNIMDIELLNNDLLAKFLIGTDPFQDKKCRDCQFMMVCGGGCPNERFINKYEGGKIDTCSIFKHKFKELLSAHIETEKNE